MKFIFAALWPLMCTAMTVVPCGSAFAQGRLPSPALNNPVITGGTISGANASAAIATPAGGNTALSMSLWQSFSQMTPGYGATIGGNNTAAINAANAAVLARGGGVVHIPGSYAGTFTYSYPDPKIVQEFDGPNINRSMALGTGGVAQDTGKVFAGVLGQVRPSGNDRAGVGFWFTSDGSGSNDATKYDYAIDLALYKKNWSCSTARFAAALCPTLAVQGGMGGINMAIRQGGPDATSDPNLKSGTDVINASVTCITGIGHCQFAETQTIFVDPITLAQTNSIDMQYGAIDTRPGELSGYGIIFNSHLGDQTSALFVQNDAGSHWHQALKINLDGTDTFGIGDSGQIDWWHSGIAQYSLTDDTTSNPAGALTVLHAGTPVFGLNASGDMTLSAAPTWAAGIVITPGKLITNAGNYYEAIFPGGTTAAGSAPTCTSSPCTGADGIPWIWLGAGANPAFVTSSNGVPTVQTVLQLRALTATTANVSVFAVGGTPSVSAVQGSIASRVDGGPGRTLYVKETGGLGPTTSVYNPVLTASLSNNVAAAGTTQATATLLTTRNNVITSVPVTGNGVILAGTSGPQEVMVLNLGGQALTVYPPSGAAFDGGTIDAPISLAVGARGRYLVRSISDIRTIT